MKQRFYALLFIAIAAIPLAVYAATQTTNMQLYKPTVGSDTDAWGGYLNTNFDIIESWVSKWGGQTTVATPANATYPIILNAPFDGAITKVYAKTDSGTCTVTVKINGVALGGTANSATSAKSTQTHGSTNSFVAGDAITFTVSANSSASNLQVQIYGMRTSDD